MKLKTIFTIFFLCTGSLFAKEGMWLPFLLEKMNEKEMKSMGMKISAKDIYDVNAGSLKDAVVIFGGGCTGEVVSNQGLVLTNHHCGYGAVQGLSSVDHNYLLNGFFAKNKQEELPCPGLSVTFIVRIDDVSEDVKKGISSQMADSTRNRIILFNIDNLEKEAKKKTGYDALVKSFFYDNEYYMFLTEKYTDIRLVGFPPNGIGKFGGDTDNWAWPRHTGDFGLFRIYANSENKPAPFDKANKPFVPRRSLDINIAGVQENDFTMVYGFPGRTAEYLTSDGVAEVMNVLDPARIKIREKRLNIMDAAMKENEETFIKYASKQAGIANYYKKWKGELLGLQINNAIEKKKKEEATFQKWVQQDAARNAKYGNVLSDLAACYKAQQQSIKLNEYINETIWSSEMIKKVSMYDRVLKTADTMKSAMDLQPYVKELRDFYKTINTNTDYLIANEMFKIYRNDIENNAIVDEKLLDKIYNNSILIRNDGSQQVLHLNEKKGLAEAIKNDPAYLVYSYFDKLQKENLIKLKAHLLKLNGLYGTYLLALKEYNAGKAFYPDANSTMRVTYGKVQGVTPQDGMKYEFYTTLDGAIRKHNPLVEEFQLPKKLLDLHKQKDFGRYAIQNNGTTTVPLAFLASNHTTGGNSGSPVLNAKGELIGTNFDRIWEGTMSDILFDPNLCRNITLDIRYTLFIIEKFGGAKWVVDEMNLITNRPKRSIWARLGL